MTRKCLACPHDAVDRPDPTGYLCDHCQSVVDSGGRLEVGELLIERPDFARALEAAHAHQRALARIIALRESQSATGPA